MFNEVYVYVDVLKEFAAKKCVKLGKLLKERGGLELETKPRLSLSSCPNSKPDNNSSNVKVCFN